MRQWTIDVEGKLGWKYPDGTLNSKQEATIGGSQVQVPAQATEDTLRNLYFMQNKIWIAFVNFKDYLAGASKAWEGYAFLTSVNIDTPMEDNSTVNMSFTGVNNPKMSGVSGQGPADRPDPHHNFDHY